MERRERLRLSLRGAYRPGAQGLRWCAARPLMNMMIAAAAAAARAQRFKLFYYF
jgi:hypothetical protein